MNCKLNEIKDCCCLCCCFISFVILDLQISVLSNTAKFFRKAGYVYVLQLTGRERMLLVPVPIGIVHHLCLPNGEGDVQSKVIKD